MKKPIRIKGGTRYFNKMLEEYVRLIYRYNSVIKETGYYLKPVHIVTKETKDGKKTYIYVGRYWWRIKYIGKRGKTSRIKWIYVGREKPRELQGYPDPPQHPLVGLKIVIDGEDILVDYTTYKKYHDVFKQLLEKLSDSDKNISEQTIRK